MRVGPTGHITLRSTWLMLFSKTTYGRCSVLVTVRGATLQFLDQLPSPLVPGCWLPLYVFALTLPYTLRPAILVNAFQFNILGLWSYDLYDCICTLYCISIKVTIGAKPKSEKFNLDVCRW